MADLYLSIGIFLLEKNVSSQRGPGHVWSMKGVANHQDRTQLMGSKVGIQEVPEEDSWWRFLGNRERS